MTHRSTPLAKSNESLMSVLDVANHANVSTKTIRRLVARGVLRPIVIGRIVRFRPSDVRDVFRPE